MIEISDHAYKRAKERLWLNKKAFTRTVDKAFEKWYHRIDTKWHLNKWMLKDQMSHRFKANSIIYADFLLYYTKDNVIKTVCKIPTNLTPIKKYLKHN